VDHHYTDYERTNEKLTDARAEDGAYFSSFGNSWMHESKSWLTKKIGKTGQEC